MQKLSRLTGTPAGAVCLVLMITLGFVIASCSSDPRSPASPSGAAGGSSAVVTFDDSSNCPGFPEGNKDSSAPFAANAGAGNVLTGVCVKAGNDSFIVTPPFDDPTNIFVGTTLCYVVDFSANLQTATVTQVGPGPTCKGISHIQWTTGPAPTPGPTPEPTPGPTPGPTPKPTPGPTPKPTPGPTPKPTPKPLPG